MLERSDRQLIGSSCSNKNPLGDQLSEGESILFVSEMYFLINSIQAPLCYNNM